MSPSPPPLPPPPQQHHQPPNAVSMATSLYVGDLHPETTEKDLAEAFREMGPIYSMRLCRCALTNKSLCYAYVNFSHHNDACKAIACLNYRDLKGKPMRIMWRQRDPFSRKCGISNLFVKNLHPSIDGTFLLGLFCPYGNILSCKVVEEGGVSKGYGYVQFDSEASAAAARAALHDALVLGKKLHVVKFLKKSDRTAATEDSKFTNLYVKNLVKDVTEGFLREMFCKFGEVSDVVIMRDVKGISKGFGFVKFKSPEDASKAVEVLNGAQLGSKNLFVGRAQSKAERAEILKCQYKEKYNFRNEINMSNLYVKNLDISVDDSKLRELFSGFGQITSAKVMCHDNGTSKGFGFVCFSTPEEANKAMVARNGAILQGRTLYVSMAQRKEVRCKELLNHHAQFPVQSFCSSNSSVTFPQNGPVYFTYRPCSPQFPLLQQQMLYQQYGANGGIGYFYATENYQPNYASYVPSKQTHLGSTGNIKNGANQQCYMTHSTSIASNKDLNQGHYRGPKPSYKKENRRSGSFESSVQGVATGSLAVAKAPVNKMNNTGNVLYLHHPFADNFQPNSTAKLTGMLLNMNNAEMIKLLNTPSTLNTQVDNKVQVKEANARTGPRLPVA